MTGTLVISHGPDAGKIEWNTEHAEGNGPLDPAIAEAKFNSMVGRGMFAFAETVTETEKGTTVEREQIRRGEFDPQTQSKVTLTPQIAGGER